jgi:dTDP-4-dehydrorhamnose reductase
MKILLFGGSGTLGKELQKLNPDIMCPTHTACDITNRFSVQAEINDHYPDIVIHAAAMTDNRLIERNADDAVLTNIVGSSNIAIACMTLNIRMVYISTDYIFPGTHGNYTEEDPILPFNLYAWSKLGGECAVKAVKNHLIIRTSFGKNDFEYKEAFTDKWTSKCYADQIAPMILEAALSPLTGVLNLGTERKTLYDYASARSTVKPVKIADTSFATPYDTSLNLQRWIDYKSSKSIAKPHTECRVCGSKNMTKYLDLGLMPLANNLEPTALLAKASPRFPLQVMFCHDCSLSQLSVVIDPEKMFSHYTYRSSVNGPYVDHCKRMAIDLKEMYGLTDQSFHIDIAGNDGTLLKEFKSVVGGKVLNVDPANNLIAIAEAQGIPSVADFWGLEVAEKIVSVHGKADLITATNVFAHLDNVTEFISACNVALASDGILVVENPYLVDFIENMEYDTLYFEHVTVWSLMPLMSLCASVGMRIISCEKQNIHGGTMRYTIVKKASSHTIGQSVINAASVEQNEGFTLFDKYKNWSLGVNENIKTLQENLLNLKRSGKIIAAFGASAKGSTLLNYGGFNTDIIDYIADETPEKLGKYTPGAGIPVVHPQKILKTNPDYIIILAWNFTDAIVKKVRDMGYKGKFIVPIPAYKIID